MIGKIVARVAWAVFTVWAVVTATFVIFSVLPEDPSRVVAGAQARPADVARIREQLALDRPIAVRYARYMSNLVRFGPPEAGEDPEATWNLGPLRIDLGTSYLKRRPVTELLAKALPPTLLLGLFALLIEVGIGAAAGVIAGARRHTPFDWGIVAATLVGISAPTFLSGLLLQHFFARELMLLPIDGYGSTAGERLKSVILPAITLGLFGAAYYARLVRDETIVLLKQDHIRTARAKGLSERAVLVKHALRNALMPLVTVVGLSMGTVVGGAIVTEKIFRWPGMGSLSVDAVFERDGPVVMGVVILLSIVVVTSNLLVDLLYAALDPRTRRQ